MNHDAKNQYILRFITQALHKAYWKIPYFRGLNKIARVLFRVIPSYRGFLSHSLGFKWRVYSRETLWTYLVSCEKYTTKVVIEELLKTKTFVVIGANFGWYPLVASSKFSDMNIFGFECNAKVIKEFKSNISLNNYKVEVIEMAVSDSEGEVNLYKQIDTNEGMSTLFPIDSLDVKNELLDVVKSTTLDNYFRNEMPYLGQTVILMDIEGSEMKALIGAEKFFLEVSPVLICEVNSLLIQASGHSYLDVFDFLESKGYQSFWIDERGAIVEVTDPINLPHVSVLPIGSGANYLFKKTNSQ